MQSLSENQCKFVYLLGQLLSKINRRDVKIIEYFRSIEQEAANIAKGTSQLKKPEDCLHCVGLAVDLGVIQNGRLVTDKEAYINIGAIWKSLNPNCVWGGDWVSLYDPYHFQINRQ